jgi:hypothetical protein
MRIMGACAFLTLTKNESGEAVKFPVKPDRTDEWRRGGRGYFLDRHWLLSYLKV